MSHKFTPEERLTLARLLFWSPLDVESAPIEEVKAAADRLSKDLEKMGPVQRKMRAQADIHADFEKMQKRREELEDLFNRCDFKEFERKMGAEFLYTQKCAPQFPSNIIWGDEFPWRRHLRIDFDYAKYCEDLDNRPTFLSWCINQAYRSIVINKTPNLGATKLCFYK